MSKPNPSAPLTTEYSGHLRPPDVWRPQEFSLEKREAVRHNQI